MKETLLVCIRCPIGCRITVTDKEDGILEVTGNTCKRGEEYARKELTDPTRILTTTVRVKGGKRKAVSVKTTADIPRGKLFDCIEALKGIEVQAPVHIGDVVLRDAAGTGVDIAATANVKKRTAV